MKTINNNSKSGTGNARTLFHARPAPLPGACRVLVNLAVALLLAVRCSSTFAQGTAFTYQGRLTENGAPANGLYDMTLAAHGDAVLPDFQIGLPVTNSAVVVSNGLFTTHVDLLSFAGSQPRWIEVAVRLAGSTNDFSPLNPRQLVTVAPKADYANRAQTLTAQINEGLLPSSALRRYVNENITGLYSFSPLPGNPPFAANSSVLVTNLNADQLDGLDSSAFWKQGGNNQGYSIELGNSTNPSSVSFIDFHYYVGFEEDYNVRLINSESRKLVLLGNLYVSGYITTSSDRNVKQAFAPVDSSAVLEKVAALPIQSWAYTNNPTTRHLGPMAQDFHAAFGVGSDDISIATVDADGVALAAIQGLNQKLESREQRAESRVQRTETRVQKLEEENAQLKQKNQSLEQRLEALEQIILNQKSN